MAFGNHFKRSMGSITDLDGDHENFKPPTYRRSSSVGGSTSSVNTVAISNEMSKLQFLMVALLEHICSLHVQDPSKSDQLFKVLNRQLSKMKIMSPIFGIDEMSPVRSQYKLAFSRVVQSAMAMVDQDFNPGNKLGEAVGRFVPMRIPVTGPSVIDERGCFQFSRYRQEFHEICRVGGGAYGYVFKVRHKLDSCHYAIKKVAIHEINMELCLKVFREVKHLASLSHKNIVRYHGAWLENENPMPLAITHQPMHAIKHIPEEESSNSAGSDSIIFADSENGKSCHSSLGSNVSFDANWKSRNGNSDNMDCNFETSNRERKDFKKSLIVLHIQMELCNQTIGDWITFRNSQQVPLGEDCYSLVNERKNLEIFLQLLKGLRYIHLKGIMHRDLKPKNIFLTTQENGHFEVKLGDFGLARDFINAEQSNPMTPNPGAWLSPEVPPDETTHGSHTSGVGTTIYAAPEQLEGSDYSDKADMYSVGLILFELYQPFTTEMERHHVLGDLRKNIIPSSFAARWPKHTKVIESMLHSSPDDRPSVQELLNSIIFPSKAEVIYQLKMENQAQSIEIANLKHVLHTKEEELKSKDSIIAQLKNLLKEKGEDNMLLKASSLNPL